MKTHRLLAAVAPLLLASGCGIFDPVVCPAVVKNAIEVEVRDADTGLPAAAGAVGVVRDGPVMDTLRVIGWTHAPSQESALVLGGAQERPGVYDVRIEKDGYEAWARNDVRARKGECGVVTVQLQASLRRSSS